MRDFSLVCLRTKHWRWLRTPALHCTAYRHSRSDCCPPSHWHGSDCCCCLSNSWFLVDCSVTAAAHTEPFPSLTSRGTQGPRPFSLSRELRLCHVTTGRRRNSTSCFLLGAPLQWRRAVLRTHRPRSPSPEVRSTLWSRSSSARTHTNLNAQPC